MNWCRLLGHKPSDVDAHGNAFCLRCKAPLSYRIVVEKVDYA